jgi:tetratricopeptide (TPR) repeat protein
MSGIYWRLCIPCLLLALGCGGVQNIEIQTTDTTSAPRAPAKTARPKPPPVKREAKELFRQGVEAYQSKAGQPNLKAAIKFFKAAIEEDPGFGAAYFNIGRIQEQRGDLDSAADFYRQASDKGKNFADGIANLGRLKLIKGQTDEAQRLFQKALQIDKYNGEALLNMAQDSRVRRDFPVAVKQVRTALKGNEKNPKAYAVLARIYFDMGRYQLAKLVCVTGLKKDPNYPDLNNTLGLVFLKLNDVRAALAAFKAAVAADENYTAAHMNIGAMTFSYRDYESSLRHFDAAVRREPKNLKALLSRSVALRGLNRLDKAESGYKAILAIDKAHVGAHYNLGILYQEYTSKLDLATTHFESVLQYERANAKLRTDVTSRINAIRIQIQNKKEVEEMMRKQKVDTAAEKSAKPAQTAPQTPAAAPGNGGQ